MTIPRRKHHRARVAIVGSGLAGLTAGYLLSEAGLEVTIFEREDKLGMDSQSTTLYKGKHREAVRVDTPMRSFSLGFYTNLLRLYKHLGVPMQRREYTYSFRRNYQHDPHTTYNGGGGLKGFTTTLSYFYIIFGFIYYTIVALIATHSGLTRSRLFLNVSHDDLCSTLGIPRMFRNELLDPIFCCVTTCSVDELKVYPAAYLLEYRAKTFLQPHVTTDVELLVEKLSRPVAHIRLSQEVTFDRKQRSIEFGEHCHEEFDHVILAYPPVDVPYTETTVVTHSCPKQLPAALDRKEINIASDTICSAATHIISSPHNVFQTTIPSRCFEPKDYSAISSVSHFRRARATADTPAMLTQFLSRDGSSLSAKHGVHNVYHAGSFMFAGIPLLEGCVTSAALVVKDILRKEAVSTVVIDEIFGS